MNRFFRSTTAFAVTIVLAGLAVPAYGQAAKAAPAKANPAKAPNISDGMNAFAVDMHGQLASAKDVGNVFFSPFSIDTALAMTYAGAAGDTAKQMAQVLHFDLAQDKLHEATGELLKRLNEPAVKRPYQLSVANALFSAKGFAFKKEFTDVNAKHYGAAVTELDFHGKAEESKKYINSWVEKQTNDRIKNLIPDAGLLSDARLVLVNAIYFKGDWEHKFDKKDTKDVDFKIAADKSSKVPLMYQQRSYSYMETDDLQAVRLEYAKTPAKDKKDKEAADDRLAASADKGLSMIVLLPKKVDGLAALEKKLTTKDLTEWTGKMHREDVKLSLPRFKMTYDTELSAVLKSMGMTDAFDERKANFSGISGSESVMISKVIHKAFVEVNEEGTEAAAATAVIMVPTAAPMPREPKTFTADRPFLFLIQDNASGAILFMGRVMDPTKTGQ